MAIEGLVHLNFNWLLCKISFINMTEAPPAKAKLKKEVYNFGCWTLTASESHILESEGHDRECYEKELTLPQLPEMVFADNILRLEHNDGFGLEFNALDALKCVDAEHDLLQVAASQVWKNARSDCEYIKQALKPFDWTFTTDYKGSLFSKDSNLAISVIPTSERINLEKLKQREKILFYQDILLFEDELADNGASKLSVKIRVMPSGVFILLRFFLRVDNVLVRINDTRLYHEAGTDFLLREYSSRDNEVCDIKVPPFVLNDPNEVCHYLTKRTEFFEKLHLPISSNQSQPEPKVESTNTEAVLR
ncbi:TIP41-like protein isoform X1 [Octopus sinensis]|uniref:TIP41-like protein n=1 Tax=Octopus sinensis TaxID=2607531 RepID=A0A7E6ETZ2_9MOLL|nr:TIP41-like protein isoform X1 [Octopus sinensis]